MRYSDEVLEDIRLGNDIVDVINGYTELRQKGSSYFGLCPFHKESTPSFSVSPDKQLYHCFGCGASGTVFNFIMNIENYDFLDTIKFLADRINYQLPEISNNGFISSEKIELKNKLYEIHKIVARKYYENLSEKQGEIANRYLDERKILPNIRKKYGLGYSLFKKDDIYNFLKEKQYSEKEILESGLVLKNKKGEFYDRFVGRLMFPIIDVQGRILGFGGRDLSGRKDTAKYLNSPDTPIFNKSSNLYSINFARYSKNKEFILVEGYIDVIALYQIGVTNVVASLGTAFNENHARVLKKYTNKAILLFDSDEAGTNAALRAIPILEQNGIKTKVLQVVNAKDPDEYIKKFGAENFIKLLNNAKSHISFEIQQKMKQYNLDEVSEKIEFTKETAKIISKCNSDIEKEVFAKEASKITGISFEAIFSEIKNFSENSSINFKKIKYNKSNNLNDISNVEEARKGLIYILSVNLEAYKIIKNYILPEYFLDAGYVKLAKIIFEANDNNKNIYPAEIVNKFEDVEIQQKVSKVFMQKIDFSENEYLEKIVNDFVKIIKKQYIDVKIDEATNKQDLLNLQKFLKQKKETDEIYIRL